MSLVGIRASSKASLRPGSSIYRFADAWFLGPSQADINQINQLNHINHINHNNNNNNNNYYYYHHYYHHNFYKAAASSQLLHNLPTAAIPAINHN